MPEPPSIKSTPARAAQSNAALCIPNLAGENQPRSVPAPDGSGVLALLLARFVEPDPRLEPSPGAAGDLCELVASKAVEDDKDFVVWVAVKALVLLDELVPERLVMSLDTLLELVFELSVAAIFSLWLELVLEIFVELVSELFVEPLADGWLTGAPGVWAVAHGEYQKTLYFSSAPLDPETSAVTLM
ncbi:MAG: hypothetical protein ACYCSF_05650 [Acidimicrobiales bacterium]